jgi:hypothetical protein
VYKLIMLNEPNFPSCFVLTLFNSFIRCIELFILNVFGIFHIGSQNLS